MQVELADSGLRSAKEKSENFLMSPQDVAEGLHRRTHRARRKEAYQIKNRDDQLEALRHCDDNLDGGGAEGVDPQEKKS